MINPGILTKALTDKFNTLALHSIVTECFVNGLILNKDEFSNDDKRSLSRYSLNVLNSIGGFHALESALENPKLTVPQKLFLTDIYEVCTEASSEAAKRIVGDTDCKNCDDSMKNIVDRAAFTKEEYKKFVERADNIGLDEVSEVIKEKTLEVIKDEQEQYKKETELDQELQDALSETKDFSDATTESYMDLILTKSDPRHHITVFSRLQETAMEMMNAVKVKDEDIFPIINKVTFEAFLPEFRMDTVTFDNAIESMNHVANEEVTPVPKEKRAKLSTLVSIIVYTVAETLKTMNLYTPSRDTVKDYVLHKPMEGESIAVENIDALYNKALAKVRESNGLDFSKMSSLALTNKLAELKKVGEMVQESANQNGDSSKAVTIMNAIEQYTTSISNILESRNLENKKKEMATESFYEQRIRSNDIAQFNKISSMFGKDTRIDSIKLKVNPDNMNSIIDVECATESGKILKNSFINMQYACESSQYIDYLKETYERSNLSSSGKNVSLYFTDGTGRQISL